MEKYIMVCSFIIIVVLVLLINKYFSSSKVFKYIPFIFTLISGFIFLFISLVILKNKNLVYFLLGMINLVSSFGALMTALLIDLKKYFKDQEKFLQN
ncbi:MAG: hypothetical protein ACOXZR_04590 [Bacilli bacterium]|jgi:hypothetical protein